MPAAVTMGQELRGRLFTCACCLAEVLVCVECDHRRRYCGPQCSQRARRQAQREAGRRYQATRAGRFTHAWRGRRYRRRKREELAQVRQQALPAVADIRAATTTATTANRDASVACPRSDADGVLAVELEVPSVRACQPPQRFCHWCERQCHCVLKRNFPHLGRDMRLVADRGGGRPHGQAP